ncbi:MAG: T9SS type A sorting domain-containing protein [Bacteroidales bacterium]|nr:T9SS type A sorting domain-containing protein [Bacteroidales bacterium]
MKKLIFIFIFLPAIVQSQNWYPIGATWYFNYQEMLLFPAHGYNKYTVVSDTVVDSMPSKLITKEVVNYLGDTLSVSSLIVREENSKVYYYNNNAFKLMYDFTLNVGDTLAIDLNSIVCDSVSPLTVDSVNNININGINLEVQYITCIYHNSIYFGGQSDTTSYKIIERVGNVGGKNIFFNPICGGADEFIWSGLRCYNDYSFSYKGDPSYTYPCDTLINGNTINISKLVKDANFVEIFPNPSSDFINVTSDYDIKNIEVYNICGKIVSCFQPDNKDFTVNIKTYPIGVYYFFVTINNFSQNITKVKKIIKI